MSNMHARGRAQGREGKRRAEEGGAAGASTQHVREHPRAFASAARVENAQLEVSPLNEREKGSILAEVLGIQWGQTHVTTPIW